MKHYRIVIGAAIWAVALVCGVLYLARDMYGGQPGMATQVAKFFFLPRQRLELRFPQQEVLYVGDPIFERRGDTYVRIGEIVATSRNGQPRDFDLTDFAVAEIYSSSAPISRATVAPITRPPNRWVG